MQIKIYGTGCFKCKTLFENVQTALDASGLEADLEKVTDLKAIADAGILMTPALEIDGKIVSSGKILTADEILSILPKQESTCSCCSCQHDKSPDTQKSCCCGSKSSGKKLLAYVLITIALIGVAVAVIREKTPEAKSATSQAVSTALTVYYFHGDMRCKTCTAFEKLTEETLKDNFSKELASGKIVYRVINLDLKGNAHFVEDFNLTTKSVVLSEPGRFRNLDQIWMRIRQGDEAFKSYVAESIREFMKDRK